MDSKEVDDNTYIKWFSEVGKEDIKLVGGKGANLGEMYNNKFPVPPGFIVTAEAFKVFVSENNLIERIKNIISGIDMENTSELSQKAKEIREMMINQELPKELEQEIIEEYRILGGEKIDEKGVSQDALNILKNAQEPIFVSVRSSATTEDLADASFAGQQQSFLNIKGERQVVEYVKKCFASLYTARAVYYRDKKGFKEEDALLAVVIQKMVDSKMSGVMFSRDPIKLNEDIVIEAVFGLGEGIVSGKIKPDNYVVSRDLKSEKVKIKIADKKIAIVRTSSGNNGVANLNEETSKSQVLSKGKILELANFGIRLEDHYKKPQDIEFAIENGEVFIVQSRPITTLDKIVSTQEIKGNPILEGLSASPGIGVGVVKIIYNLEDLNKIKKGDVLVTTMTDPDMVVSMQKSSAIVTDEGGMTSHAAIVSREMGIPAIVGTGDATKVLKNGMTITVDGNNGKVYEGAVAETEIKEVHPVAPTKLKLKVISDLPAAAERASKTELDSIGLMRLEGVIASFGKHPLQFEKEERLNEYTELLEKNINEMMKYFNSIWIRSSDLRTDEYGNLQGAPKEEINPMLGLHGIRFSLKHPKILEAELQAIRNVVDKNPNKKIGIMFPQVISVKEVKEAKEIYNKIKNSNMEFGIMVETPASVQIIDELCPLVDFISFGTNDLTQYTLAIDRNNEEVQYLYDEMHPSIRSQIKKVLDSCNRFNVESSICGQAGSKKEMVKFLLNNGIKSISVNADKAKEVSELVRDFENEKREESQMEEKIEIRMPSTNNLDYKNEERENIGFKEVRQIEDSEDKSGNEENGRREEIISKKKKKKRGFEIKCSECGKEDSMPFKPKSGRPVYCKDCHMKRKGNIKGNENKTVKSNSSIGDNKIISERVKSEQESKEQNSQLWKRDSEESKESMRGKSVEGPISGEVNKENIGVYNPNREESEKKFDYKFEDDEDEFSKVF